MRRSLLTVVTMMTLSPASAGAEWRSLRSEHFHIIGDVSSRQLRDVALRFEQFRDVVTRLNLAPTGEDAVSPTTILVFRDRRSFEPFMPRVQERPVQTAGMFIEGPDRVYIAVRLDRGEESFQWVFHEYSHLLIRRVFPEAPLWLQEGLAEYYSTLRITGERSALIGYPVVAHVQTLQQGSMPLPQLFAVTDRSPEYVGEIAARRLLYAQSWALIHHAFQGRPPRSAEIVALARKLAAGADVEESVRALYGMPVAELELRLLGYVRNGSFTAVGYRFRDELVNRITVDAAPMTDAEADGWLGDLLAQMGRDDEAQPRLEDALRRQPGIRQAHEALALLLLRKERPTRRGFAASRPPTALPPGAQPFLRITLADEHRSFGTLETLACRGDQVEFVVRTAQGPVRAAGRFEDIQLINYRFELGDVLCGAQPSPLPTLLTWKPGTDDSRRAIAVEFLPDGFIP